MTISTAIGISLKSFNETKKKLKRNTYGRKNEQEKILKLIVEKDNFIAIIFGLNQFFYLHNCWSTMCSTH